MIGHAIERLFARRLLDPDTPVFPLLEITRAALPGQTPSPYINDITVSQLVNFAGGWNDNHQVTAKDGTIIPGTHWDPMFNMRAIAKRLGLMRPVTKRDIASYMYGEPLQFIPGTQDYYSTYRASYNNLSYLLLGMVIETVTGEPFIDYVRDSLRWPEDKLDLYFSRTAGGSIFPREVWYASLYSGLSALEPNAEVTAPFPEGGEGWFTESADANGGLMTTAATLARFISRHAVWGIGGRAAGSSRDGSQAGTSSFAASLENGVDLAFIFNSRDFTDDQVLSAFTNEIVTLAARL